MESEQSLPVPRSFWRFEATSTALADWLCVLEAVEIFRSRPVQDLAWNTSQDKKDKRNARKDAVGPTAFLKAPVGGQWLSISATLAIWHWWPGILNTSYIDKGILVSLKKFKYFKKHMSTKIKKVLCIYNPSGKTLVWIILSSKLTQS